MSLSRKMDARRAISRTSEQCNQAHQSGVLVFSDHSCNEAGNRPCIPSVSSCGDSLPAHAPQSLPAKPALIHFGFRCGERRNFPFGLEKKAEPESLLQISDSQTTAVFSDHFHTQRGTARPCQTGLELSALLSPQRLRHSQRNQNSTRATRTGIARSPTMPPAPTSRRSRPTPLAKMPAMTGAQFSMV